MEPGYKQLALSFDEPVEEVRYDVLLEPEPLREEVDFANVQRVFEESKVFQFSAPNKIRQPRDVAYIFKQLETAAVENAFAVLVKNGKPTVIHLSMGRIDATYAPMDSVVAADKKIKAEKVYFIHNHPSGNIKASVQDIRMLEKWRNFFGDKMQPGIIINTRSGLYGEFDLTQQSSSHELVAGEERQYPVKLYSFSKLVFEKEYQETEKVQSSRDVAQFVSSQRLGKRPKLSYLVLSTGGDIQANIHTHYSNIQTKNIKDLSQQIIRDVVMFGGSNVVSYGSAKIGRNIIESLSHELKQNEIKLLDHIQLLQEPGLQELKSDLGLGTGTYQYKSACEMGWINPFQEPEVSYGNEQNLFQRVDGSISPRATERQVEAIAMQLKKLGLKGEVRIMDGVDELVKEARKSVQKKTAPETAAAAEEATIPTAISSAEGAKVLKNIETLAEQYQEKVNGRSRTFIGDVANALGIKATNKPSRYKTFEAKNGRKFTIRLSNHNATVSNFDNVNEINGISIVVTGQRNSGIVNDGNAHIVEFFYSEKALRSADGKPLAAIIRSIEQALYSGEYKDTTGLAQVEEVNGLDAIRLQSVFHGSPHDFEAFDFSHMGKGEGAQAYGWGGYVTEVEGIGKSYAEQKNGRVLYRGKRRTEIERLYHDDVSPYGTILSVIYKLEDGHSFDEAIKNLRIDYKASLEYEERNGGEYTEGWKKNLAELEALSADDFSVVPGRNLYHVEIPTEQDGNYLRWEERVSDKTLNKIVASLEKAGVDIDFMVPNDMKEASTKTKILYWTNVNRNGSALYDAIRAAFGNNARAASELLSSLGFVGVSYPSQYYSGGRKDNARNYVIFKESDMKITDHIRYEQDGNGEIAGATLPNGDVLLNREVMRVDTPFHEFAHKLFTYAKDNRAASHLYDAICRYAQAAPQSVKNYVSTHYLGLSEDAYLDEVFAWALSKQSERGLETFLKKRGLLEDKTARTWYGQMWATIKALWEGVRPMISGLLGRNYADLSVFDAYDEMETEKTGKALYNLMMGGKALPGAVERAVSEMGIRYHFIGEKGATNLDRTEEVTIRIDNLSVAREMETAGKAAKTIKIATGWERGADGKWRYEEPDFEVDVKGLARKNRLYDKLPWGKEYDALVDKILDGGELSPKESVRFEELSERVNEMRKVYEKSDIRYLDDYVKDKKLFDAYPEFKQVRVELYDAPKDNGALYTGATWYAGQNLIRINEQVLSQDDFRSVLTHEVQHAIQETEGFARGGNRYTYRKHIASLKEKHDAWSMQSEFDRKHAELGEDAAPIDVYNALRDEYHSDGFEFGDGFIPSRDAFDKGFNLWTRGYDKEGYEDAYKEYQSLTDKFGHGLGNDRYRELSGEVEARNVQSRLSMTPEERRASLASETEDVAREKQISLNETREAAAVQRVSSPASKKRTVVKPRKRGRGL
ncbi:JAB domain-containing protein [bacterium]|nr:JAB domain-containing protein [bacterium]